MFKKKTKPDPALPPEEETPLHALVRLHWRKAFFCSAAVILAVWGIAVVGDASKRGGGAL
ncbi:MAG: hypothetical protein LBS96_03410 [Oscillospiraceae bacterium]|nr:hypothetical protein [Oscillospiraceae bacterium]